jgi:hypothetical protein
LDRFGNGWFYICTNSITYTGRWHRCHRLLLYDCVLCKQKKSTW